LLLTSVLENAVFNVHIAPK